MDGETEGKAKLTAAWRAAVVRMIEAGYNPADVHETMISVGLTGKGRSRPFFMMLVSVAVVGVSALVLFSDLTVWRTFLGLQNQTSEQQQEALGREREEAERLKRDLAAAGSEIEALKAEGARALAASGEQADRLNRDLVAARSEIEALKAEGSRALAANGEAVRAAEAKRFEQISQDQRSDDQVPQGATGPAPKPGPASTAGTLSLTTPEQALLARASSLLKDRDISGARLILERALEAGSTRAAFQLAETYDPRQLSRWRAYGIRGDWAKAQALYLRALDGGIIEAKDRIAPIR